MTLEETLVKLREDFHYGIVGIKSDFEHELDQYDKTHQLSVSFSHYCHYVFDLDWKKPETREAHYRSCCRRDTCILTKYETIEE